MAEVSKSAIPDVEEKPDFDYDGGFLTQQERRYLAGVDDFSDYSNPSVWRGRVREKYRAALLDQALLNQASADVIDAGEMQKSVRGELNKYQAPYIEEMVTVGVGAVNNMADTYGDERLHDLVSEYSQAAKEIRETRETTQEFMVRSIMRVLAKGDPDYRDVEKFIEGYWPDKETVLEIAENQWKDS